MSFSEDDLLPLSGLQHLLFCERQCALIHVEGVWTENALTVDGAWVHSRVDDAPNSTGRGVRTVRGLAIRSYELGVSGRSDVVEFGGSEGHPFPIEYKRGRRRSRDADDVQLCAQAMALEEMTGQTIPRGAVYHARSRRRREVLLDDPLRERTRSAARRFHEIFAMRAVPVQAEDARCRSCSLKELCQPRHTSDPERSREYVREVLMGRIP